MKKLKTFLGTVFVACILMVAPAMAVSNVSNKSTETKGDKYEVKGFRSAVFGQTQKEVLKSIKDDFGIKAENVKISRHAKDKTTIFSVKVKSLSPFTIGGTVNYIFGYKSNRLFQVNVQWVSQAKTKKELVEFSNSALSLLEYYARYDFSDYKIIQGAKIKDGIILLGLIHKKAPTAIMELALVNIKISMDKKKQFDVDIIKGKNAKAQISYIADAKNLDVFKINDGEY